MFDNLQQKLNTAFKNLSGKGKISEKNIKEAVRDVKMSLLEADVNYKVVKAFIEEVKEEAMGVKVMESLSPDQEFIRVVRDKLIALMGGEKPAKIELSANPAYIMLAGLQGAGKTTSAAKLAKMFKEKGKKPLLVAADVYRPAAIDQLVQLSEQIGVSIFTGDKKDARKIVKDAKNFAEKNLHDIVIVDTAGRLHIDKNMMNEVEDVKKIINPEEILMVVDSMMGQDSVNAAKEFNDRLEITGFIVTKLDGDSRGGVIISIKNITGKPIKFAALGEKIEALEPFFPDRYAGRILGMGDILSLIEKVEKDVDQKKAEEEAEKFMKGKFDLEDFLAQLKQLKKLGPLGKVMEMIPGVPKEGMDLSKGESEMKRMEAIISSMTSKERRKPDILTFSRKKRIAAGSGTTLQDINKLLKSFEQLKKTMKHFGKMGKRKMMKNMPDLPFKMWIYK